jgi:hypothetical protein
MRRYLLAATALCGLTTFATADDLGLPTPVESGVVVEGAAVGPTHNAAPPTGVVKEVRSVDPFHGVPTVAQPAVVGVPSQPLYLADAGGCGCASGGYTAGGYVGGTYGYDAAAWGGGVSSAPWGYTGAVAGGTHERHPYYSYRRPWYYQGPASQNVTIIW